jgi:hypothetical protein
MGFINPKSDAHSIIDKMVNLEGQSSIRETFNLRSVNKPMSLPSRKFLYLEEGNSLNSMRRYQRPILFVCRWPRGKREVK